MTKRKEVCTMMPSSADVGGFLIKGRKICAKP